MAGERRHVVRVRDGNDTPRLVEGNAPGQFELGPYGVTLHGANGVWTLIPWSNVTRIEPTS